MTEKQLRLLRFIAAQLKSSGLAPTYQEMQSHLGMKSKSTAYAIVSRLVKEGLLVRNRIATRGLEVTQAGYERMNDPAALMLKAVATVIDQVDQDILTPHGAVEYLREIQQSNSGVNHERRN
jgi:SOS-response transcriptional repressor LexA